MNMMRNQRGFTGFFKKSVAQGLPAFQMLEDSPIATMMCDREFTIVYANPASITALKKIQNVLPVPADRVVGQSIDIFHKNPRHQRGLLSDPKNLPHKARIALGGEWLDLHVVAINDDKGTYIGPMLSWAIVTEAVKHEQETKKLLTMLDMMPINVMLAHKDTLEITYANRTSIDTLRPLQHNLPCKADEIVGKNIDIFHKNPTHQRRMLGDYQRTLPHRAVIPLGNEKLELSVSALKDNKGEFMGPMVTWTVVTESIAMAERIKDVVGTVSTAATEMQASADSMSANAETTNAQVATVASASEELSASIAEISRQITKSSEIARSAKDEADEAVSVMSALTESANKIDKVVKLINDIADKTNLLALNATIEAARAGEAGKGFAVVAAEVKALASQTGAATGEISEQVGGIQKAIAAVATANQAICQTVMQINEISSSVAAAVEEQSSATDNVAVNIAEVSKASSETGRISADVNAAASELALRSEEMRGQMVNFLSRFSSKK